MNCYRCGAGAGCSHPNGDGTYWCECSRCDAGWTWSPELERIEELQKEAQYRARQHGERVSALNRDLESIKDVLKAEFPGRSDEIDNNPANFVEYLVSAHRRLRYLGG